MTPAEKIVSIRPGTPYKEVVRLLADHQTSALPVLGEAGRVLGVVSETDLPPPDKDSPFHGVFSGRRRVRSCWPSARWQSAPAPPSGCRAASQAATIGPLDQDLGLDP